eukprot:2069593-Prorocentrum_lima.AAC.1
MNISSARANNDRNVIGVITYIHFTLSRSGTFKTVQPFHGAQAEQGWHFAVLEGTRGFPTLRLRLVLWLFS